MKYLLITAAVFMMVGCGMTPEQQRRLAEVAEEFKNNAPKTTHCTRVGDQIYCRTY